MAALVVTINPRVKFSKDQISAILDLQRLPLGLRPTALPLVPT
jgi:hypothetical protein